MHLVYGHTRIGRPTKTNICDNCMDTECSQVNLPRDGRYIVWESKASVLSSRIDDDDNDDDEHCTV